MNERIEILSTQLLREQRIVLDEIDELNRFVGISSIGWHYPLDWGWIISHLGNVKGMRILDAGAGSGILQWYLAEKGCEVVSVDRDSRTCAPFHLRKRYAVRGLRPKDLLSPLQMIAPFGYAPFAEKFKSLTRSLIGLSLHRRAGQALGKVYIYNQDLKNLAELPDNSIDAIVSVSALEHNPIQELPFVVQELTRVLKQGGAMVVTMAASKGPDWYHEPSKGWCYSEATLKSAFSLAQDTTSNYDQYDRLFDQLKRDEVLRAQLSKAYFRSSRMGMPLGIWDPQYQPVGIIKIKPDRK